ncbi:MAG: TonB-dependent receptor [Sphingomonadales bacterium]|nr:TonB-dependent receptor [Sphingomonadales bacterium]
MNAIAFRLAILAGVVGAGGIDSAQSAKDDDRTNRTLNQIIVTGSRIPRPDLFSLSPITTLDEAQIVLSGITNLDDLLNTLPQVDGGFSAKNPIDDGTARINLRGLGDFRTLVMLSGRRYAASGIFGSVDLNAIPPSLIERIEVITGGASAVYGSDAVAGAVNFILNDDFSGVEATFQFDITDEGDGETYDVGLTYGTDFAGERGHIAVFGNYHRRTIIFQGDRAFSRVPLEEDFAAGELILDGSVTTPDGHIIFPGAEIDSTFGTVTFEPDGVPRLFLNPDDLFNFAAEQPLRTGMERFALSGFSHFDLLDELRAVLEFSFVRTEPQRPLGSAPAREFVTVNTDWADLTPEFRDLLAGQFDPDNDGLAGLFFLRRLDELGDREIKNKRDFFRVMAAFDGQIGSRWSWETHYSYSRTENDQIITNEGSTSRYLQALLVDPATGACADPSGGCVPVNPFGAGNVSDAAANFIRLDPIVNTERHEQQVASGTLNGTVYDLPAGSLDVVLGAEWRRNAAGLFPDNAILTGEALGRNADVTSFGVITVKEIFGEARIPLVADRRGAGYVGLEGGVRISDYNTSGSVWTWKLGSEWQPHSDMRIRASYQRAVRAPGVGEAFQGTSFFFTDNDFGLQVDPCSASRDPVGSGVASLCIDQGVPADQIGIFEADFFPTDILLVSRPDLEPEQARSITAGVVYRPSSLHGASLTFDYFVIRLDNAVDLLAPTDGVALCFLAGNIDSPFCQSFSRGPSGDISEARFVFENVAFGKVEGFDWQLVLQADADQFALVESAAQLSLSVNASYYLTNGSQTTPLVPFTDCAGFFGPFCGTFTTFGALPRATMTNRLTYDSGPFTASVRWRWISGMTNSRTVLEIPTTVPKVGAEHYVDLTLVYRHGDRFSAHFGVQNLLDNDPPLLGDEARFANTDPSTYDTLGRRFFLRLVVTG